MPLEKACDFIVQKHIVKDRQAAMKLLQNQIGNLSNLQVANRMCFEEFNRLFSKAIFKTALISTISKLKVKQDKSTPKIEKSRPRTPDSEQKEFEAKMSKLGKLGQTLKKSLQEKVKQKMLDQDAAVNYFKEIPLSIRIEKYQREKLMQGVKPERDKVQEESFKYLQSLKFI